MDSPQAAFGQMVERVAGQALATAGYTLEVTPLHNMRGLFRYHKQLSSGATAYLEFQLLFYQGGTSRFRINLLRNTGDAARDTGVDRVEITLSRLLWDTFNVQKLGSPDYWWLFESPTALAYALADAGKLLFGFGIPWIEGTLSSDGEMAHGV